MAGISSSWSNTPESWNFVAVDAAAAVIVAKKKRRLENETAPRQCIEMAGGRTRSCPFSLSFSFYFFLFFFFFPRLLRAIRSLRRARRWASSCVCVWSKSDLQRSGQTTEKSQSASLHHVRNGDLRNEMRTWNNRAAPVAHALVSSAPVRSSRSRLVAGISLRIVRPALSSRPS